MSISTPRDHQLRPQGALALPQLPQLGRLHGDDRERRPKTATGCHGERTTTADSWRQLGGFGENDGNDGTTSLWKIRRWLEIGDDFGWCVMNMCTLQCLVLTRWQEFETLSVSAWSCPRDYWSQTKLTEQEVFHFLEDLKIIKILKILVILQKWHQSISHHI